VSQSAFAATLGTPGRSRGVALASCAGALAAAAVLLGSDGRATAAATALGPPAGALDRTFGTGGKVVTDLGRNERASAVAALPDGRIAVAGSTQSLEAPYASQFLVARYRVDGRLDPRFGSGGWTAIDFGPRGGAGANAVALQLDGKLVLAGLVGSGATGDFALARITREGTLDRTFGTDGTATSDFGGTADGAFAVALQPDGKIVIAGTTRQPGPIATSPIGFAVARYTTDGALDTSFGRGGHTATRFEDGSYTPSGVVLQPDGKIVVVGMSFHLPLSTPPPVLMLARYNANGTLDSSFGGDGLVTRPDTGAFGAVVTHGKIVVAGWDTRTSMLLRFNTDGTLDRTFGAGGVAKPANPRAAAYRIALQADGEIVAAGGTAGAGGHADFAVARFNPDGHADPAFGIDGGQTTDFGADSDEDAYGLALAPGGKIVLAGVRLAGPDAAGDIVLARYHGAVCVVPSLAKRSLAAARKAIATAGCAVNVVRSASAAGSPAGQVIRQQPRGGTRTRLHSRVTIVVSRETRR
jgi:uncharacterized delta-60 repeat protein